MPATRLTSSSRVNSAHALGRGLVGAWAFVEMGGATIHDISGRGNHAAITGTPNWGVDVDGRVAKFTGATTYAKVENNSAFNAFGTGPFSAVARVKLTATPAADDDFLSWDKGAGGNAAYWRLRADSGPNLKFESNSGSFTGGATLTNGVLYQIAVTRDGAGTARLYMNGVQVASGSASSTISDTTLGFYFATLAGSNEFARANYSQVLLYNRKLTDREMLRLYLDPWCMVTPFNRSSRQPLQALTLSLTQGSYAHAGQSLGLNFARLLAATQGAYAHTGESLGLFAAKRLVMTQGAYALTGEDLGLYQAHRLAAVQGSYAHSGQSIGLLAARRLQISQGSYAHAGQALGLNFGKFISLLQGSYTRSGQNITLLRSSLLSAIAGSYSHSGQNVTLTRSPRSLFLTISTGYYVLTGRAISLIKLGRPPVPAFDTDLQPSSPAAGSGTSDVDLR